MTVQEMNKAISQAKAEGLSEEEILLAFYRMFQDDKITHDELKGIVDIMGYHLSEEFENMSPEDQKTKGVVEADEGDSEENKEKTEELNEEAEEAEETEEAEEEKKAMKLFGQDK